MSKVKVIGIDLAKSVFHIFCTDSSGKALAKHKVGRDKLLAILGQYSDCQVFMEACGSSHYWGRQISALGHDVKLIAPQFVKPFLKSNKNDYLDAEATAEAGTRQNMRFVPIKSQWHQDMMLLHRVRERLIKCRVALSNEIRGFLLEYGVEMPVGKNRFTKELPSVLENRSGLISALALSELHELADEFRNLEKRIETCDKKIALQVRSNEDCQRMQKLKGVGPIIASAIVASTPDPHAFKNGRQFAAWLGLVPRQHSTGGQNNLLGISKRGDPYLRKQLIHGCRSAIYRSKPDTDQLSNWVTQVKQRRGCNKAIVALANKNARLLWAIMTKKENFKFVA